MNEEFESRSSTPSPVGRRRIASRIPPGQVEWFYSVRAVYTPLHRRNWSISDFEGHGEPIKGRGNLNNRVEGQSFDSPWADGRQVTGRGGATYWIS